jgi:hypothetical protein
MGQIGIPPEAKAPARVDLLENVRATFAAGVDIIEKKNKDYGADADPFRNFRSAQVLGISVEKAILVRTLDKLARIDNLLTKPAYVTEESLEDTLTDAINYLALLKAFREMK